jgi:hypothetical protein
MMTCKKLPTMKEINKDSKKSKKKAKSILARINFKTKK